MNREIRHTWFFNQPPEVVWEYLTKPELLEQWLMKSDFKAIVGHKFRFIAPTGKIICCEVSEVNPITRLSYFWQANPENGIATFNTKVVWTAVPKGNGTELQLVHNGFTVLEDYTGHNNGWTALGGRLAQLLNEIKYDTTNL
jgi:uncharacterized protein YndB with AHSA1/START domain